MATERPPQDRRPCALLWLRRDLRLTDNPALIAAVTAGYRILPVYIDDPAGEGRWPLGAAARAWLRRSLGQLATSIAAQGGRLLLCRGDSLQQLRRLIAATGARALYWNRRYEPAVRERDASLKEALGAEGIEVHSRSGHLLREPWQIATAQGGPYRVFTPFWRRLQPELETLPAAEHRPRPDWYCAPELDSDPLDSLLPAPRPAWDRGFWELAEAGERGAQAALQRFLERLLDYPQARDFPATAGGSGLSPHLAFGEVSGRQIIAAVRERFDGRLPVRAEPFLRQLGWREFAYHLLFHFPHSCESDLTEQMRGFDWAEPDPAALRRWQRGDTGFPAIDAGMRELWISGRMHNRARMWVASFLCKNLGYHWIHGARWFWDTLVDADLANNSLGWQWSAGSGADAAPYFRIFNPVSQGQRFDPEGGYLARWIPALAAEAAKGRHTPWLLARPPQHYPPPMLDLAASRAEALARFHRRRRN